MSTPVQGIPVQMENLMNDHHLSKNCGSVDEATFGG